MLIIFGKNNHNRKMLCRERNIRSCWSKAKVIPGGQRSYIYIVLHQNFLSDLYLPHALTDFDHIIIKSIINKSINANDNKTMCRAKMLV